MSGGADNLARHHPDLASRFDAWATDLSFGAVHISPLRQEVVFHPDAYWASDPYIHRPRPWIRT